MRNPEVEELFAWFDHCYDLEVHPMTGRAYYKRVSLPSDGAIGSQDARLIYGLTHLATVQQQVLDEQVAREAHEARATSDVNR